MALNYGNVLQADPAEPEQKTPATRKPAPGIPAGSLVIQPFGSIKLQVGAEEIGKALEASRRAVQALEVVDQVSAAKIIDIAAGAKRAAKTIKAALDSIIAEPEARIKECKGIAKIYTDTAAQVEIEAKGKVAAWQQQERIRKEREEREKREKAEALNRKMREEAAELNIEAPQIEIPTAPSTPAVVRTEGGAKASTAMVWVFDIVNEAQLPREYLIPDEKKIRDAIRLGAREIPGVNIYQKEQIRIG